MYFRGWSIHERSHVRLSPGNTGQLWLTFSLPATRRRVFMLVDVLDLVGSRGFAEIGRTSEKLTHDSCGKANVADMLARNSAGRND